MAANAVAIDAMSGDFGPRVIVPASLQFLQRTPQARLIFVGQESVISRYIPRKMASKVDIVHASEVVAMDEMPAVALRSKPQSSMHIAVDLVKNGDAGGCISAGNTGALMAISKIHLRTIAGVSRPAICGPIPTREGHSYLLDMGANVDCDARHLLEFALMAQVLAKAVDGNERPTVALLNNGEELCKGNQQVKRAAELFLADKTVNYTGYVEGHRLYQAAADIIVCDGFVGNVALKASEGVATYIMDKIGREIKKDPVTRFLSFMAMPEIRRIKNQVDPRRFNGACFLGVNGVVVKSHGHADETAFIHALDYTYKMLSVDVIAQLQQLNINSD